MTILIIITKTITTIETFNNRFFHKSNVLCLFDVPLTKLAVINNNVFKICNNTDKAMKATTALLKWSVAPSDMTAFSCVMFAISMVALRRHDTIKAFIFSFSLGGSSCKS